MTMPILDAANIADEYPGRYSPRRSNRYPR